LATGSKRVLVLTTHQTKKGHPKLVDRCTFPLTAVGVVDRVISDLGVFDPAGTGYRVVELAPGVTLEQVKDATGGAVIGA
jgi:3-oxoacid CoA-transferase subunit B